MIVSVLKSSTDILVIILLQIILLNQNSVAIAAFRMIGGKKLVFDVTRESKTVS